MPRLYDVATVSKQIMNNEFPMPIGDSSVLSYRQRLLDYYFRFFKCTAYRDRKWDWDGREAIAALDADIMANSGYVPPGVYDPSGALIPLRFRKPSVPYHLARIVVSRFTSLLFSTKRHPSIECNDKDTEDWLNGFIEESSLWSAMIQARTYGGAMGSVGIGFKFIEGKPIIEVHDPRWITPYFSSKETLTVAKVEKRYQYSEFIQTEKGKYEEVKYWYRRLIDDKKDSVWNKVPVKDNEIPDFNEYESTEVAHNFGFCPFVWVQNIPDGDAIDGESDCLGIYDLIERIDTLLSQADRGTVYSCDPFMVISSDTTLEEVSKSRGNALQLEKGGAVDYLEMTGSGIDRAVSLAEKLEEKALTIARCNFDRNEGGPSRSPIEIEHNYSSMTEQADILRKQYGDRGIKPLLLMVLKAARKLEAPKLRLDNNETIISKSRVILSQKAVTINDETIYTDRNIGLGEILNLRWPNYFTPSSEAILRVVDAAARAKSEGLIDTEHAVAMVAEYFGVENKIEVLNRINQNVILTSTPDNQSNTYQKSILELAERETAFCKAIKDRRDAGFEINQIWVDEMATLFKVPKQTLSASGSPFTLTPSDIGRVITVNEGRSSLGLPPKTDGEQYLASFESKLEVEIEKDDDNTDDQRGENNMVKPQRESDTTSDNTIKPSRENL